MKKTAKLSLLNNIRSSEGNNDAFYSLKFPVHHKNKRADTNVAMHHQNTTLISIIDVEKIVFKAYTHAEKIINCLQLGTILQTHNMDDLNTLSSFIFDILPKHQKPLIVRV
jgi:hypothetical protein